jgi:hypothetical protein
MTGLHKHISYLAKEHFIQIQLKLQLALELFFYIYVVKSQNHPSLSDCSTVILTADFYINHLLSFLRGLSKCFYKGACPEPNSKTKQPLTQPTNEILVL